MKYKITKSQYDATVMKLLDKLIGKIRIEERKQMGLIELYLGDENFADIQLDANENRLNRKIKCKKKLVLFSDISRRLSKFFPVVKKQRFAKVVSQFFYQRINILVDCVEFDHSFKLKKHKKDYYTDEEWNEYYKDAFYEKYKESLKKIKKK